VSEIDQLNLGPVALDLKINVRHMTMERRPVACSLGPIIDGVVPPHPCLTDTPTAVLGVAKRIGRLTPAVKRTTLRRFRTFVHVWIRKNLRPLSLDQDLSFETWVMSRPYSLARKRELIRKFEVVAHIEDPDKRYYQLKCFVKDEFYPEFKMARGIFSRSDEFKCFSGPIFSAIEKQVFKLKWFIKYVPVSDRARHIQETMEVPGAKYIYTDYTAFESSFSREFMDACEFELYRFMTGSMPHAKHWCNIMEEAILGGQILNFKEFSARINARRQSGEMCTSLGNGFSNLMIMLFACSEQGMTNIVGFVEGDDGLFRVPYPERLSCYFTELGFDIKLGETFDLSRASFCGLLYDTETGSVITEPLEAISLLGWGSMKYARASNYKRNALLRAKALSMAYQYPSCPLISSMAWYVLKCTGSVTKRDMYKLAQNTMNQYEFRQFLEAFTQSNDALPRRPISMSTRILMAGEFGIPVAAQLAVEQYLDGLTQIQTLRIPLVTALAPRKWVQYADLYVSRPDLPCTAPVLRRVETVLAVPKTAGGVCPVRMHASACR